MVRLVAGIAYRSRQPLGVKSRLILAVDPRSSEHSADGLDDTSFFAAD